MTDLQEQAERVLRGLRANPDLLFRVSAALQGEKIAGPWVRTEAYRRERRGVSGGLLVLVRKRSRAESTLGLWEVSVSRTVMPPENDNVVTRGFISESEAMQWADEALTDAGYSLATEVQP